MKNIILKYVIEQFGDDTPKEKRIRHYSYCLFPEEECTCRDLNQIEFDTSLIRGGYIDSFSMVVVLLFLEETFNIKISDMDAVPDNFDSVNKMVELVMKYKK